MNNYQGESRIHRIGSPKPIFVEPKTQEELRKLFQKKRLFFGDEVSGDIHKISFTDSEIREVLDPEVPYRPRKA